MIDNFFKLIYLNNMELVYKYLDEAKCGYILRDGLLINRISDIDSFELSGNNIVFGIGEILLEKSEGFNQFRYKDVYITNGHFEELPIEKIFAIFKSPKLGYAVAKTIAISLTKVNEIFSLRINQLTKSNYLLKEYCKLYAKVSDLILEEYSKKRYFWLEELYNKITKSLCYKKGKAFLEVEKTKIIKVESKMNELDKNFPHGVEICKQGDETNEMFILRSGVINVFVSGSKVAEISEPGTLIGEMALLLSQKRSATLVSHGNVTVSIINKENVNEVIKNDPDFFLKIATTHSKWEANNCVLIREIDEHLKLQENEKNLPKFLKSEYKYKEELFNLRRSLSELNLKYNDKFLDKIEDIICENLEKINNI